MKYIVSAISGILLFLLAMVPRTYAQCVPFTSAPNLYQVNRTSSSSATLYFTPLNDSIQSYVINYGLSEGDNRYSVKFDYGSSTGAIAYTISGLEPAFTYYYSVSAINSCSQSPWSNWKSDKVSSSSATLTGTQPNKTLPAPGSGALILGALLSGGLVFGGATFFRRSAS